VQEVKPKIIVCLGKWVFDRLWSGERYKADEIDGAWLYDQARDVWFYLMETPDMPIAHPAYVEKWARDIIEIPATHLLMHDLQYNNYWFFSTTTIYNQHESFGVLGMVFARG
jgi:hypothetical protein